MRKGWTAFLIGAFVVTVMHAGVARALVCTQEPAVYTHSHESPEGCIFVDDAIACPSKTQLTGGGCSADPALTLLSSAPLAFSDGQQGWSCTYIVPSVDGVCQDTDQNITATSICCR
jgi:hypothetical protein